jgi:hypothetical protein
MNKTQLKTDSEKKLYENQIKTNDNEIDQLVYKFYELMKYEKKIVWGT